MTSVVSSSGLEDIWTVSRCLEYLLLSGLVPEAAWFSNEVGDWKAALSISAALMKHKEIFPMLYERFVMLTHLQIMVAAAVISLISIMMAFFSSLPFSH